MSEIKDLLDKASIENLATQEVIQLLISAIKVLESKVEELEAKIDNI